MPAKVHLTLEDRIARIRLDDGKANTIEQRFLSELTEALDVAEKDAAAVLIEGREGRFCAGLDLKILPALGRVGIQEVVRDYMRLMTRLFVFPRPVVAALSGHAIAGGALLALASDVRVAADGPFQIGLREVAIGIPLPTLGCELARATLPTPSLLGAVLRGELYAPQDARRVGMVDRVVSPEELTATALIEARNLAKLPDIAFATTKRILRGEAVSKMQNAEAEDVANLTKYIPEGP